MMLCYDSMSTIGPDANFAQSCLCDDDIIIIMSVVSLKPGDGGYPLTVDIIGLNFEIE